MISAESARIGGIDLLRGITPRPTQAAFLNSNSRRKVYIGNLGTGKTQTLVWQDLILHHLYPPNNTLIGRYRYRDLADTTRKRYLDIVDPDLIADKQIPEKGDGFILWKTGGRTLFRNLDDPGKFGSLDLGGAGLDEVSECPAGVWDFLDGRMGRHWSTLGIPKDRWPYCPLYAGGNPGGRDYIWKMFFDPRRPKPKPGEVERFAGFHPKPRENEAALPPNYYEELAERKPDWWIRRYIKGVLGAIEGLVWPSFDEEIHVIPPMPIPNWWRRYTGHDHGKRHPTAVLWVATDDAQANDPNIVAYREFEMSGLVPAEVCKKILTMERRTDERIEQRWADPSMFNETLTTPNSTKWHSVADEYEAYNLVLDRGDNAMEASLIRVETLLWPDPKRRFPMWHPKAGEYGSPRLFITANCERTIEEVSSWRFPDARPDGSLPEKPIDVEDDLCDCLRFLSTGFPESSKAPRPESRPDPGRAAWQADRNKRISKSIYQNAKREGQAEIGRLMGWEDAGDDD